MRKELTVLHEDLYMYMMSDHAWSSYFNQCLLWGTSEAEETVEQGASSISV